MFELKSSCLAIVGLPLAAAMLAGFCGKVIGQRASHLATTFAVGLSFFLSLIVIKQFYTHEISPLNFTLYTWGQFGHTPFTIGFLIDQLTAVMMLIVTFVSWMVHIYSIGYMRDDPGYQRFFCYISLFTFGMLMLISANNFLQLFFGWEMVGLMSYLLIGFWFKKESAIVANLKAFIVNRVGDFGFLIGIAAVLYCFGTLDYRLVFEEVQNISKVELFQLPTGYTVSAITFICLCLFVGAMGKSAQVPLHVWLPDSMEGPTPISALIHAATMVTAGVFMIARLSPLFEYSELALNVILTIGTVTCFLMGLVGIVQNDIKRIIAYSTLSQLGYMMIAMGVSAYPIGIFHLVTHAFFKALLFLGAGSIIFALHHEQDIWKMGNLRKSLPITYYTMLVGSLALIGFPFFSGFYSKDLIIEAVKLSQLPCAKAAYYFVVGGVYITALYTFRLFFVVFHLKTDRDDIHVEPNSWVVEGPLVLLAIPSLVLGALFLRPLSENYFAHSLVIHPEHSGFQELMAASESPFFMALHGFTSLPFVLGLLGIITAWIGYVVRPKSAAWVQRRLGVIYYILKNQLGFDAFYRLVVVMATRTLGLFCWRWGDQWLIDGVGVNGTANTVKRLSQSLRKMQTGYLYHYAFVMIVGFLVLIAWLLLSVIV